MGIGARLREERERLGLNQEGFGQLGGVRKQAQLLYEKDERRPDSDYLAAVAAAGVDVLFVLTGRRQSDLPAGDASEQLLLENFRRCSLAARENLLQSSVLLAAGLPAEASSVANAPTQNRLPRL
ncbi:helix-turn-helix domain-containing protein [Comamonas testosteroni]|uniref:helix-turn-helix domain-containing protein n=1 Tax=Comamonas testosteroni TaxID=285 RepID=UPI0026F24547|nr:transcriptional regulator [Comamonas testosteroni]WQD45038.1 transcriptional regulator [Comamonas testosteroni]